MAAVVEAAIGGVRGDVGHAARELGGRDVVQAEEVIDYTRSENMAERFAKRFGAAIGGGAVDAMHGMLPAIR